MYGKYWRRGGWAWLFMICANVVVGVLVYPITLAFTDQAMGRFFAMVAGIFFGIPVWGWLFEYFAKKSERIE